MGVQKVSFSHGVIEIVEDGQSTRLTVDDMIKVDSTQKLKDELSLKRGQVIKESVYYHKYPDGKPVLVVGGVEPNWTDFDRQYTDGPG